MRFIQIPPAVQAEIQVEVKNSDNVVVGEKTLMVEYTLPIFIRKVLVLDHKVTADDMKLGYFLGLCAAVEHKAPGDIWEVESAPWEFLVELAKGVHIGNPDVKLALLPIIKSITGAKTE